VPGIEPGPPDLYPRTLTTRSQFLSNVFCKITKLIKTEIEVGTNFADKGGRSVGIVRSRTKATELVILIQETCMSRAEVRTRQTNNCSVEEYGLLCCIAM
jgi:hypothetical protein